MFRQTYQWMGSLNMFECVSLRNMAKNGSWLPKTSWAWAILFSTQVGEAMDLLQWIYPAW